jgi:hypothetical protein
VVDPSLSVRERQAEYQRRHRAKHPGRHLARDLVRVLVNLGLVRPGPCAVRGCKCRRTEAHHPDHDRPLEFHWICRKHHLLVHRGAIALPRPRPVLTIRKC